MERAKAIQSDRVVRNPDLYFDKRVPPFFDQNEN
jgi:hypothetical protein